LTCGFDAWIESCRFSRDNRQLRAKLKSGGDPGRKFNVLACMNSRSHYAVRWNGEPADFAIVHDGLLQIELTRGAKPGELLITRMTNDE
jgi:hypothetical protein